MLNVYENQLIEQLPKSWKENQSGLEKFLEENWKNRSIFYDDEENSSHQQFINFKLKVGLKTNNYIGTIVYDNEQINIFPKVFKEKNKLQSDLLLKDFVYNLSVWLSYCDKLNFPFVEINNKLNEINSLAELLIAIYTRYVDNAVKTRPFYQYEEREETGSTIRGRIDVADYYCNKMPQAEYHRMNYRFSEFVHDNLLNRIIKCVCKYIYSITNQESIKNILRKLFIKLGNISDVNCKPFECDLIHLNRLNNDYEIILRLSKIFLYNKQGSNTQGSYGSFCFLFPSEMLFEGFVAGFMREHLKDKASITAQSSKFSLADIAINGENKGKAFNIKPDILIEHQENIYIADTKYKLINLDNNDNNKYGISQSDMYQMVS
ncbi:MAG: hypothetical protein GX367_10225, partial [Bacteroidales bacterium]|nr:hypothetical protein [Bacteroidales bacterium]